MAKLKAEKYEAYHLCEVFQNEIDMLRRALELQGKSQGESDIVHSSNNEDEGEPTTEEECKNPSSPPSEDMSAEDKKKIGARANEHISKALELNSSAICRHFNLQQSPTNGRPSNDQ